MRAIAELLNKHVGEEAWIFGKGPSLDGFDFESAGNVRICINESLLIVPQAKYFFAHDEVPIQRVSAHWPSCCGAILEPKRCDWAKRCGIPDDLIYNYVKRERELEVLNWSAEQIAAKGCLLGLSGTAHSAIHFCRLLGVSGIALVGMDGGGGYAKCIEVKPPLGGGQHDLIRKDSIKVAQRLALPIRFAS